MTFSDFSPSACPSREQQCDALRKGLGRAVMWSATGRLAEAALLDACLHDQRYDMQCEDERTEWLWRIMGSAGTLGRFRDALLAALTELPDERGAQQLCGLARLYANVGDEVFRRRLYEIVESRPLEDCPWLGDCDLVELDGESAFLFSVRSHGARLAAPGGAEWDSGNVADFAVSLWGKERVHVILASSQDAQWNRAWGTDVTTGCGIDSASTSENSLVSGHS